MTREAGFTLVETLVVLALLGLTGLLAMTGIRFGVRAWDVSESRNAAILGLVMFEGALRDGLVATIPPLRRSPDASGAFQGSAAYAEWTALRGSGGEASPMRHRLRLLPAEDGMSVRLEMVSGGSGSEDWSAAATLTVGRAEMRFARKEGAGLRWDTEWNDGAPPAAIALTLWPSSSPGEPTSLIIVPRLSRHPNCAFDTVSLECRAS